MDERLIYKSFSSRLSEARRMVSGYGVPAEVKRTSIYKLAAALESIHSRINNIREECSSYRNEEEFVGDIDMTEDIQKYDLNGDGVIDEQERRIMLEDMRRKMEDEDAQRDSIRKMAWFALIGLLLYPFGIFLADAFAMGTAAQLIADIAPTYFASIAVLVSAFFGASALAGKKKDA